MPVSISLPREIVYAFFLSQYVCLILRYEFQRFITYKKNTFKHITINQVRHVSLPKPAAVLDVHNNTKILDCNTNSYKYSYTVLFLSVILAALIEEKKI